MQRRVGDVAIEGDDDIAAIGYMDAFARVRFECSLHEPVPAMARILGAGTVDLQWLMTRPGPDEAVSGPRALIAGGGETQAQRRLVPGRKRVSQ